MIAFLKKVFILCLCLFIIPCYSFSDFDCDLENNEDISDFIDMQDFYNKNNKINNLMEMYNFCIAKNPDIEVLYVNRGNLNRKLKNYEQALSDYNKALEIKNNDIFALYGKISVLSAQNNFEEALKLSDKLIKINSNFAGVYYEKGIIYFKKNDYIKAVQNFKKCLSRIPFTQKYKLRQMFFSPGDVNFNIGLAYFKCNENAKALQYMQNALKHYKLENDEENIKRTKENINILKKEVQAV